MPDIRDRKQTEATRVAFVTMEEKDGKKDSPHITF